MKIAVIGGGASGILASAVSASKGYDVTLIEKNEKLGKKLYITGKGRCNVTNLCTEREFLNNVVTNPKFLNSAIYGFSPQNLVDLLENCGLRTKVERGNRVFPTSDKASDVIKTLSAFAVKNGVKVLLNTKVTNVVKSDGVFIVQTSGGEFMFDKVVIATGGVSYKATGSDGDGYRFAKQFGHDVISPVPSLCSIVVKESYVKKLEGLSLKNVAVGVYCGGKRLFSETGEMLFTDKGVAGPLILSASAHINRLNFKSSECKVVIDLKPSLSLAELDLRVLRDFKKASNKDFQNSLSDLLPKSLIPVVVELSKIPPTQKVNQISAENRKNLVFLLKNLTFFVKSLDDIDRAVVTSGGVNVKEINPKTMQSKLVDGLYFCGEVLDVDAYTGGFNLQIAFSTAFAAANGL